MSTNRYYILVGSCVVALASIIASSGNEARERIQPRRLVSVKKNRPPISPVYLRIPVPKVAHVYYIDLSVRELAFGVPPDAMADAAWAKETWSGKRLADLYVELREVSGSGSFSPSDTRLLVRPVGGGQTIAVDVNGNMRFDGRDYLLKPAAYLRCYLLLQPSLPKQYLDDHYPRLKTKDIGR